MMGIETVIEEKLSLLSLDKIGVIIEDKEEGVSTKKLGVVVERERNQEAWCSWCYSWGGNKALKTLNLKRETCFVK